MELQTNMKQTTEQCIFSDGPCGCPDGHCASASDGLRAMSGPRFADYCSAGPRRSDKILDIAKKLRDQGFKAAKVNTPATTGVRAVAPIQVTGEALSTDKQRSFIESLVGQKTLSVEHADWVAKVLAGRLTKAQASKIIDRLLGLPNRPVAAQPTLPEVPEGRYAVENEAGELRFYVVDRPTEGKWAGRTFVSVQASDELYPVKGEAAKAVLAKIAVDPRAASIRYGHELGHCGVCGRTLTDENSRAAGIGPICASKTGW